MRNRSSQSWTWAWREGALSRVIRLRAPVRSGARVAFALVLVAGLANCAGGPTPGSLSSGGVSAPGDGAALQAGPGGGPSTSVAGAPETEDEFDCGHLTGRMQVRILQIRDYDPAAKTSGLSRSLQGLSNGLFGGSSRGLAPDAQYSRDVEELRAQNKLLGAHGCKTYDLDSELQPHATTHTPRPR